MNSAVQAITWQGLALALVPTAIVLAIMWRWTAGIGTGVYATLRMLVQLLLIGYVLVFIFETGEPTVVLAILGVMLLVASWISIRPLQHKSRRLYRNALIAISLSGVLTLALVSQAVIGIDPWFSPRYLIPLAGMIFAGAMNTISLAGERADDQFLVRGRPGFPTRHDDRPDTFRRITARGCQVPDRRDVDAVWCVGDVGCVVPPP